MPIHTETIRFLHIFFISKADNAEVKQRLCAPLVRGRAAASSLPGLGGAIFENLRGIFR
jgi:hypothetical protein